MIVGKVIRSSFIFDWIAAKCTLKPNAREVADCVCSDLEDIRNIGVNPEDPTGFFKPEEHGLKTGLRKVAIMSDDEIDLLGVPYDCKKWREARAAAAWEKTKAEKREQEKAQAEVEARKQAVHERVMERVREERKQRDNIEDFADIYRSKHSWWWANHNEHKKRANHSKYYGDPKFKVYVDKIIAKEMEKDWLKKFCNDPVMEEWAKKELEGYIKQLDEREKKLLEGNKSTSGR